MCRSKTHCAIMTHLCLTEALLSWNRSRNSENTELWYSLAKAGPKDETKKWPHKSKAWILLGSRAWVRSRASLGSTGSSTPFSVLYIA